MVRSKKNVVSTRGGDEAVAGKSFYSSSAARPALKVLDALMNTEAPSLKLKDKRPAKPKSAAQLYAEDKCEEMLIDSGLHESRSKLAIKSCKDDAMAAFKSGQVEQEVVEIYTEKEQAEKTDYERRVDEWNENHPDEKLVIGKNGTAILSKDGPEGEKQKDKSSRNIAKKMKVNGPGTTKELQAISGKAAEKLKKLRAKKQLKAKKKKSSAKSDMDMLEDDDDEEEYSEEESDVEISDNDDDDDQENDKDEEREQQQPVRSKAKKGASSEKGGEKDAAVKKYKAGTEKATARKRKAESSAPEPEEHNNGTKASKRARSGIEKGSDAIPGTEKKIASSKKRGKKEHDHEPVADADDPASRRKPTRASVKEQKMVATEQPPAKRNKKQAATEGKTAKSKDACKQEALPAKSRLSSRTRKPQNSMKHLGPTMPKASPAKSNSAYTGDYDVPSDDE